MLTVYFDDSGTHPGSEITLLAGLFGHEQQWTFFEELWRRRLHESVPGKQAIKRFHMTDCYNSLNEFAGWNRTETDFFAKELADIIFRCGLWGCCSAIDSSAWNEHIIGDVRRAAGDPEGGCIRTCFTATLAWAAEFGGSSEIAFVFDDRPHRKREYEGVYNVFSDYRAASGLKPTLASLKFERAAKNLPLQAADLFAWEVYQDEMFFLKGDGPRKGRFHRPFLKRLADSGRFRIQSGDRASIANRLWIAEKQIREAGVQDDLDKYFGKA